MDNSIPAFLRLPTELRHQIYRLCFAENMRQPGLLNANSAIRHDVRQYMRKYLQTFTFNITGKQRGFDAFSKWCFRVKGHTPKFHKMKHLIVNISPPDPYTTDHGSLEMWNIWITIRDLSIEVGLYRRVLRVTMRFLETKKLSWAHGTMGLRYPSRVLVYHDVGQILIVLARYMTNINKPMIILPESFIRSYHPEKEALPWASDIEKLMTGYYIDQYLR